MSTNARFQETDLDQYSYIRKDIFTHYLSASSVNRHKQSSVTPFSDDPLFTPEKDIVDFNKLNDFDYLFGTQYNAGLGDDVVVLPFTYEDADTSGFKPFHDFHGAAGNDTIIGGKLFDYIYGDSGDDHIYGGDGMDYLNGGSGNDQLDGGAHNDRLSGYTGDDHLNGGAGNDELSGDDGNDIIFGGKGDDEAFGGEGDDQIFSGDGNDVVYGDATPDQFYPNQSEIIGNDTLMGGTGNDQLWGGKGNDILIGGSGNDHLIGDAGTDVMTGGSGKDIFYFSHGSGTTENSLFADVITDFEDGVDLLKLFGDLKFSDLIIEDIGVDCLIYVKQTYEHLVIIQNAAGQISVSDFA